MTIWFRAWHAGIPGGLMQADQTGRRKMSNRIRAGLRAGAAAAALCAAGLWGAYTVAQTAAEQAFTQAVERLRAALPPNLVLEHGAVTADPVSGRITVADVAFGPRDQPEERLRAPQVVVDGLRPLGGGVGSLSADSLVLTVAAGGAPHRLMTLASLRVTGLTLPDANQPFDPGAIRLDAADLAGFVLNPINPAEDPGGRIGRIALGGIGGDRPDRLDIEGVELSLPDMMVGDRLVLGRLSAENLRLLPLLLTLAAGDVPMPPLERARLSLEGLAVTQGDAPIIRLGRLVTEGEAVGGDPNRRRGTLQADGLDLTVPPHFGPFTLGYSRIQAAFALAAEADLAAGDVNLSQFRLALQEVGTLEISGRMTGLAADPMRDGRLHGFRLRYTDAGLVARALAEGAKQSGMRAEELREQIVQMSPMLFSGPSAERNVRALRAFLANPTSLTVTAAPPAPVAIADLEREGGRSPDGAARVLNITVTSP
jgi:hypothetical protein